MRRSRLFSLLSAALLSCLLVPPGVASAADVATGEIVSISGVLRSADGVAVSKANLGICSGSCSSWVKTGDDGSYSFVVESGKSYSFTAYRYEYEESFTSVGSQGLPSSWNVSWTSRAVGGDLRWDLVLPVVKVLTLHLADVAGNPIYGAVFNYGAELVNAQCGSSCVGNDTYSSVRWSGPRKDYRSSGYPAGDLNGDFSFATFGVPNSITRSIQGTYRGASVSTDVLLTADSEQSFTIPLSVVSGVLRSADGVAVSKANLGICSGSCSSWVKTGDDGSYSFVVESGKSYSFTAYRYEYEESFTSVGSQGLPSSWNVSWTSRAVGGDLRWDLVLPVVKVLTLHLADVAGNPIYGAVFNYGAELVNAQCGSSCVGNDTYSSVRWSGPRKDYRSSGYPAGDLNGDFSFATFGVPNSITRSIQGNSVAGNNVSVSLTFSGHDFVNVPETTISGDIGIGRILKANQGDWGIGSSFTYKWLRDGVAISGANQSTYTLTNADNLHEVSVSVTGSAPEYFSTTRASSRIKISTSVGVEKPNVSGDSILGSTLAVPIRPWSDEISLSYRWFRDGSLISKETASTYEIQKADVGHRISFEETAIRNGFETLKTVSNPTPIVKKKLELPIIQGKASVGKTLSTKVFTFGAGTSYTYQWLRDGVAIQGASDRKYVLTPADLGSSVSFRVCGSNLWFDTTCLVSNSSVVTLGDFGRIPSVGLKWTSLKVGAVISGKAGSWDAGVALSYSWFRDGVAISNENQATYTVTEADRGHAISFRVLAQKPGYKNVTRTSVMKLIP